jgi:hypothetical protein
MLFSPLHLIFQYRDKHYPYSKSKKSRSPDEAGNRDELADVHDESMISCYGLGTIL